MISLLTDPSTLHAARCVVTVLAFALACAVPAVVAMKCEIGVRR